MLRWHLRVAQLAIHPFLPRVSPLGKESIYPQLRLRLHLAKALLAQPSWERLGRRSTALACHQGKATGSGEDDHVVPHWRNQEPFEEMTSHTGSLLAVGRA